MNAEAKRNLLSELCRLSPFARNTVEELLAYYEEQHVVCAAEKFFAELDFLPTNRQPLSSSLFVESNAAITALKKNSRWFSTDNLPHEIWRAVEGYEEFYSVSNFDRLKSFHTGKPRILTNSIDANGYAVVNLSRSDKPKKIGVHLLVARAFLANPENKPVVHHRNGDKSNACVWNLEWVTNIEHYNRSFAMGKSKKGSEHVLAALTPEQVRNIRQICIRGDKDFGVTALSRKFNVSPMTISRALNSVSYQDVL